MGVVGLSICPCSKRLTVDRLGKEVVVVVVVAAVVALVGILSNL